MSSRSIYAEPKYAASSSEIRETSWQAYGECGCSKDTDAKPVSSQAAEKNWYDEFPECQISIDISPSPVTV